MVRKRVVDEEIERQQRLRVWDSVVERKNWCNVLLSNVLH